jgi:hypothetical protein
VVDDDDVNTLNRGPLAVSIRVICDDDSLVVVDDENDEIIDEDVADGAVAAIVDCGCRLYVGLRRPSPIINNQAQR